MNWIMLVIAFFLGAISMFMMVCIGYAAKQKEPENKVHFSSHDTIGIHKACRPDSRTEGDSRGILRQDHLQHHRTDGGKEEGGG